MNQLTVEVIIPTYKPGDKFIQLIEALEKQSYPIQRIHVIDTETGIFPTQYLEKKELVYVTHIKPETFDHGATRDMGANMSKSDILVYMTQDAVPANRMLIEELIKPFINAKVGAAYARQLPAADCSVIERYTRDFNYPSKSRIKSKEDLGELGIKTFFCSNVCAAYRKTLYESLGGFAEKAIFNEDMIMAGQLIYAGYRVAYASSARVVHSHNYGCMQQFRRNFDLAVSQKDHPEIFKGIKSEEEGIRLVLKTAKYIINTRKPWLLLSLVVKSGFKYIGYKLGMNYHKLPIRFVKWCSMNPRYWD